MKRMRCLVLCLLALPLAAVAAERPASTSTTSVRLPPGTASFPAGPGAELAGQCLICHSAEMVLLQPAMPAQKWVGLIEKMRDVYGAPVQADQVQALAAYLAGIKAKTR
jgi:hypothetical protein